MEKQIKTDVVVLGGGISGLSVAHFLTRAGIQVRIVEKAPFPGGNIRTVNLDGFQAELGPTSILLTSPEITQIVTDLGLESGMIFSSPLAQKRFILRQGKLLPMPFSPLAFFLTPLFSWKTKLRLLKEPWIPPHAATDEPTLAAFVRRRLGEEILQYAVDPFVSGVFAGSPERLSVRAAFPRLWQLEQTYGSFIRGAIAGQKARKKRNSIAKNSARMFSFHRGLHQLIDAFYLAFQETFITGASVQQITREGKWFVTRVVSGEEQFRIISRAVVSAIPAYAYPSAMEFLTPEITTLLKTFEYAPIAVVFLGYHQWDKSAHPLNGYGFLVPQRENRRILGVLWNSAIFPERAPIGGAALTVYIGGARQPELVQLDNEALLQIALNELKDLMHVKAQPDQWLVKTYARAIPQYTIGHEDRVAHLYQFQQTVPGFYFAGNFLEGVSVSDCMKNGSQVANKVLLYLEEVWNFHHQFAEGTNNKGELSTTENTASPFYGANLN